MGKSEEEITGLPPIPEGYKLIQPQVSTIPELPPIPEGYQLAPTDLGERLKQPQELPPIPEGYRLVQPMPDTKPRFGEIVKDTLKGVGQDLFGMVEAPVSVFSELLAFIPSLATTLGAQALGKPWEEAEQIGGKVGQFIGYQPTTKMGEMGTQALGSPYAVLSMGINEIAETMAPDEPETQAMLRTAMGLGLLAIPGIKKEAKKYIDYKKVKGEPVLMEDFKTIVAEEIKKGETKEPFKFGEEPAVGMARKGAPKLKTDAQIAEEAMVQRGGRYIPSARPEPKPKPRIIKEYPEHYIEKQNKILQTEADILKRTKKPQSEIAEFIENDFMDGAELRKITQDVIAGKTKIVEAAKEISDLIEDTVKPVEKVVTKKVPKVEKLVPEIQQMIKQEKTLLEGELREGKPSMGEKIELREDLILLNENPEAYFKKKVGDVQQTIKEIGKPLTSNDRGWLSFTKGQQKKYQDILDLFRSKQKPLPEIEGIETRPLSEAEVAKARKAGLVEELPPSEKKPVSFEEELKTKEPISMLPKEEMERAGEAGYIKVEVDKTFGGSIKTKAYQNIFDRFHSIKKLTDIVKKEGAELPAVKDPYMGIRNYLGVQGKAETKIFYKRFKVDDQGNIQFKGESLKSILEPIKPKLDDFRRYLVDRRVPELEGRGIKTGRNLKEAKEFIREHGREFEPHAKKYTEYMHSLLDELQETGFLSKQKLEVIKSHNQMYAPFDRVIKDIEQYGYIPSSTKILSKITSPLKRIKGSERPIIDPLESAIKATYRITNVVERNRIANQIIGLRKMSPEIARIIKPKKPQMSVTVLEDGTKVYRPSVYQKEGIIEVMEKGKRHYYEVPKELYDAMSQLDKVGYGWMTKILAAPARLLRTGATTAPEFAFRNPVRDQWFAFVNSKYGYIPGYDFAKGLFTLAKKPELYWKWKASGGEWSMLVTLDRASSQISLKKVLGIKDYKKYMKNPIGFFEDVSMIGEMPTRLGVFERAQKKAPDIKAAFESREASIDFARRGAKTKTISALYTFLNARLQGMEKLIRTAKDRPVETTAKIMAVAVIPSVINYLVNRDDPYYWEIPEWQRDLFWIIPIRKEQGVMGKKPIRLRIPKGDVGVIFGTTTEKILEYMDKSKEGKLELDKLAISIIKESMPISDVGGFLPVAARIPVELMANEKFFYGRPIVSQGKEKLEPRYQHSPFTSETAKAIGKVFNISPAKIEHLITGYGAGMARYALKLNDGILGEMGVLPKKPERSKELADIPVVRAFTIRDPRGFGSESVQNFYETLEGIEKFSATEKKLKQEGKQGERIKYIKSHEVEFIATRKKLDTEFRTTRSDLAALRKIRDGVLDDRELTKEQKEEVMNEINALVMAKVITVLSKYRALEAIERKKGK